jgi:pSer/pThr/pTyr-binding forkhead associated (FHA) protein
MNTRLVLYKGDRPDLSFVVAEDGTSIGRDAGNLVQLVSPEVSKRHAHIRKTGEVWHLRDLDSRNGLFVNGKRVRETVLRHGDQVTVGPHTLVFLTDDPGSRYRPDHVVDLSSDAMRQTMSRPLPPGPNRST